MDGTLFRRFIRRHFVAFPLCILVCAGAITAAVFASSGSTSASDKRQIAAVIVGWQRMETFPYLIPSALAPQVERLWAAKGTGTTVSLSPIKLTSAQEKEVIDAYAGERARLCAPASAHLPLTAKRRRSLATELRQELDPRGEPPLTHLSLVVTAVVDVGRTTAGHVVRVTGTTVQTDAMGRSSTFPHHQSDYRVTRAADGRWLVAEVRFLDRDGSSPPSLVPWYWERWFLWAVAVELALVGLGLAVKMYAEGTRPRERHNRGPA
jgi:hypothetical protein